MLKNEHVRILIDDINTKFKVVAEKICNNAIVILEEEVNKSSIIGDRFDSFKNILTELKNKKIIKNNSCKI